MITEISRARRVGVGALFLVLIGIAAASAQVAVTTWHYDNERSGANRNETLLTPLNVNAKQFGPLFSQAVDGAVIGQALYVPRVTIPKLGVHNVAFVATMNDSVYAFDADNATAANASPLWHTSFLINGAAPVPVKMQGCGGTTMWTEIGILSTPVIDPISGTLYVVAKTYENSQFVHRLHALHIATGLERQGSPILIGASYEVGGKHYTFAPAMQVNRPALLLANGYVYIAFGSNGCRGDLEQGWVVAYNAATLQPAGAFDDEPGESAAAVWMRGGGLAADSSGAIYGATADGPFAAGLNFGQSIFKLSQVGNELQLADWFTPFNEFYLDHHDLDMSEPVLVLQNQPGRYPTLLAGVGKEGTIYILNPENMGHFCSTCTVADTQIVQELPKIAPEGGALVYWNDIVYASPTGAPIIALPLANGVLGKTPLAQTAKLDSGHSPVISANGNTEGILWQLTGSSISAFNAITLQRLYTSHPLPVLPHFANLVVANGKVYVGTNNSLVVYGLL